MDIKQLASNGPIVAMISSADTTELSTALQQILNGQSAFTHYTIVHGGDGSIRLFLQQPFGDAVDLPRGSSRPLEVAEELMRFADETGRYPENSDPTKKKGWTIRALTINFQQAAVAEATWV